MEQARRQLEGIDFVDDAYAVAQEASAVVIVTEWNAFRSMDLTRLKARMASPVLVDLRNIYRGDEVRAHGFIYAGVGRPSPIG
jgi:UDPglucose 6-dehydrogenase